MQAAPLFAEVAEVAEAPPGAAFWTHAADGVRLRVGVWGAGSKGGETKGTVLMFPGRTEYVEKYGMLAGDLAAHGYAMIVIDWRGQGLADHIGPTPMVGHVRRFADFQLDVDALLAAARALALPEPFYLMAHSMGGCIGLRALHRGIPVRAAAFSAPMWGLGVKPHLRPLAWIVTSAMRLAGRGTDYAPGTGPTTYVRDAPFAGNTLTTDPEMWALMARQVTAHPELALGGPSMVWVNEALIEMARLRRPPYPATPTLVGLGLNERVVNPDAIRTVMSRWRKASLLEYPGAEHELLMEILPTRTRFLEAACDHFAAHA